MTLVIVVVASVLIGLSLGALGGWSVLTAPVLVYGLGQSAAQATTGALLVRDDLRAVPDAGTRTAWPPTPGMALAAAAA